MKVKRMPTMDELIKRINKMANEDDISLEQFLDKLITFEEENRAWLKYEEEEEKRIEVPRYTKDSRL